MALNLKSPWVIGGAVVGVVVLLVIMRGSSASSGASAASLAAADASNVQLAGLSADLQLNADNANAAITLANIKTGGAITAGVLSLVNNFGNNETALQAQRNQITGAIVTTQQNNDALLTLAPEMARISADSQQALATTAAGEAVNLASISSDTYKTVAPQLAQISSANQQALATITGNTAQAIAGINASAATTIAGINQSGATNRQLASSGGGILNGIGGLVSGISSIFGG